MNIPDFLQVFYDLYIKQEPPFMQATLVLNILLGLVSGFGCRCLRAESFFDKPDTYCTEQKQNARNEKHSYG